MKYTKYHLFVLTIKLTNMDSHFQKCINNMVNFIKNNPHIHEWIVSFEPEEEKGFMWSEHEYINEISKGVEQDGHSGCSFALCLRSAKKQLKNIPVWVPNKNKRKFPEPSVEPIENVPFEIIPIEKTYIDVQPIEDPVVEDPLVEV